MKTRKINTFFVLIYISMYVIVALIQGCDQMIETSSEIPTTKQQVDQKKAQRELDKQKRELSYIKIIADKQAPIENRLSGADFLFGNGSITKSQTVYYFISTDGKMVEVDIRTYSKYKIGDSYKSSMWY